MCIMALGIVVRLIAPNLKDKIHDPAVIVVDELGTNVISVLSGHWGGANELTVQLAEGLEANPVITTATDVHGFPAIEMLAKQNGWVIEPLELVKKVNAAIVNDNKVTIYSEVPLEIDQTDNVHIKDFADYCPQRKEEGRVVLVTNKSAENFLPGTLFLRPQNLYVGVGCRKGVGSIEVRDSIISALRETGLSLNSVKGLSSVDIKSEEQGLLEAAQELKLPIEFFTTQAIKAVLKQRPKEFSFSEFVDDKIGVGGVCEPVAIMGAGETSKLVLKKTKNGKVTIAIAVAQEG